MELTSPFKTTSMATVIGAYEANGAMIRSPGTRGPKMLHFARTAGMRKLHRCVERADQWPVRAGHVEPAHAASAKLAITKAVDLGSVPPLDEKT